jgi:Asp-tRNA(Asn)/Glu-tRNA(Gln) amidotransferase A subunit family amidase
VADLELGLKVVIEAESKQAKVEGNVPLPWREVELPKKLKFGYFVDDGFCKASPACARAVGESVAALEKAGHECVPISPPNAADAMEIFVALSSAGGCELQSLRWSLFTEP